MNKYKRGKGDNFVIIAWKAQDAIRDPLALVVYLTLKRIR